MSECIFCRIAAGEIPAKRVNEDEHFLAFPDVRPQAPVHLLVIPRKHIASLDEVEALGAEASARALEFIAGTARVAGLAESGYRVITNTGPDAGQEVEHLHWHLVGGARLGGMV